MSDESIGERHLELLAAVEGVARHDPAGVSTMYQAAEKVNLNPVVKEADRQEFMRLMRDLEEAGYVEIQGVQRTGSRGSYSVTEEGRRRLEES